MNRFKLLLIGIVLTIFLINTGEVFAESYPRAIAWNNIIYLKSDEEININNIGKEIGKIERQRSPMPRKNGESNDTPVGSLIFEIKNVNTQDAVAVKIDNQFFYASEIGTIHDPTSTKIIGLTLASFVVLVLIIFGIGIWKKS